MNRLNWIQQEQKTADYHVLTWRTSHFHHPRNRTDILGAFGSKPEAGGGAASQGAGAPEGIGFGLGEPAGNSRWRTGGLGADGMAEDGRKDAARQEVTAAQGRIVGRSSGVAAQQIAAAVQTVVPEEVYSVLGSARQSVLKVHDRVKRSAAKLRDIYRKQQERQNQAAGPQTRKDGYHKQPENERRQGTRRCDKDDMLSMQAQNHYLLDSYDRNGQYSMLGK